MSSAWHVLATVWWFMCGRLLAPTAFQRNRREDASAHSPA